MRKEIRDLFDNLACHRVLALKTSTQKVNGVKNADQVGKLQKLG